MVKIAITPERILPREAQIIADMLERGKFDRVHLRHPDAPIDELRRLIDAIPASLHPRLHLHSHFKLALERPLGGVHLNMRWSIPPEGYTGAISASCHSIYEVHRCQNAGLAYVTLSPIFNSLSKPGYNASFDSVTLRMLDTYTIPVMALGGVTPDNIALLRYFNFAGYAMMTAAWGRHLKPLKS